MSMWSPRSACMPSFSLVLASTVLELPVRSANQALYPNLIHSVDARLSRPLDA